MVKKSCERCGVSFVAKYGQQRYCCHACSAMAHRYDYRRRFESFFVVGNPADCWEWMGGRLKTGYGAFWLNGRTEKAHRVSWEIHRGKIPEGLFVLHKCDNPPCVNPEHLFIGTTLDNVRDKIQKGRLRVPRGEDSGVSKLTEAQVIAIRADRRYQAIIASEYGVAQTTISNIKRRKKWGWLSGDTP